LAVEAGLEGLPVVGVAADEDGFAHRGNVWRSGSLVWSLRPEATGASNLVLQTSHFKLPVDPLRVQTAQNVDLAFATAGLGDRILAWIIDIVVIGAYFFLVSRFSFGGQGGTTLFIVLLLPALLYHLLFEVFFEGQS